MRFQCAAIAAAVLLTPQLSRAQAYWQPTPTPIENAAREPWQVNGEAIYYQGAFYYPVGPTEFFDGNAMQRTGDYEGVPLYENRFVEPQSLVYVPVSRGQFDPKKIHAELGKILIGKASGRRTASEITVFDSTGLAIHDIALGAEIVRLAKKRGIGRQIDFI